MADEAPEAPIDFEYRGTWTESPFVFGDKLLTMFGGTITRLGLTLPDKLNNRRIGPQTGEKVQSVRRVGSKGELS